ncbi:uncharacterized protein LOC127253234 [Andrographis paniculata]|uniref:uncharacterized protein LOC127253234 n=1 Tax=Andrographis paniculata TaxID=175694 RepID=UPI0021E7C866|nr:uncharacterized protein LOC127253234 [Andrographis paniculata]
MNWGLADRGSIEMNISSAGDASRDSDSHTTAAVGSVEIAESNAKSNGSVVGKPGKEGEEANKGGDKCSSCVIDIKGDDDLVLENQKLCRICHLSAKEGGKSSLELSELGCGCKGELGVAHLHCAEAWFRIRGNRLCEICGQTAKNITGVGDNGFMDEWNENRSGDTGASSSEGSRRCLRGQPLCNLLMACLVIAFVLPWFFRVNMF